MKSIFLLALVLTASTAFAGGRVEIGGGSNITIGATPGTTGGYTTGTLSFTGSIGVNTGSGVQPTLIPTVAYAAAGGTDVTAWDVVGGLTFNFTFSEAIMDSVYSFIGAGYGSVVSAGTTTATFPYLFTFGKRFAITGELTYKPEIRFEGAFQSLSTLPTLSFLPIQFSFFL